MPCWRNFSVTYLLIWDNRGVNHARKHVHAEKIRRMRRGTVSEPD